jgi:hypothetical protein
VSERGARVRKGGYINKLRVGPVEMGRAEIMGRVAFFAVRFDRAHGKDFCLPCASMKTHGKLVFHNFIKFRKIIK